MTKTDALAIIHRVLGPTGYLNMDPKASRDDAERLAHQERAAVLRNEVAGIEHAMRHRTKMLQDADAIYEAMEIDRVNTIRALNTAQDGARWRCTIGFRYNGPIFQIGRQVAHGTTCQRAIDHMTAAVAADPTITARSKGDTRE